MATYRTCPKCGADNNSGPPDQCVQCGVYYHKWLKAQLASARRAAPADDAPSVPGTAVADAHMRRWLAAFTYMDERTNPIEFGFRGAVLVGMMAWGWLLIGTDPRVTTGLFPELSFYDPVISMFLLVFHEAGHVIFSIFGRFMAVAGGTLLQLLVPLILLGAFVFQYRNPFGGAVALWLLGYAFMDVGPYCYDARDMELMLLGGGTGREVGGHDWNNLLRWTGNLEHHESLALFFDTLGEALILCSIAWGGWLLRLQYALLDRR